MKFLKKVNSKAKSDVNSGFGTNASNYSGRFITKKGKLQNNVQLLFLFEGSSQFHGHFF